MATLPAIPEAALHELHLMGQVTRRIGFLRRASRSGHPLFVLGVVLFAVVPQAARTESQRLALAFF